MFSRKNLAILINVSHGHYKYYALWIEKHGFAYNVKCAYGPISSANPNVTLKYNSSSKQKAIDELQSIMREKVRGGYELRNLVKYDSYWDSIKSKLFTFDITDQVDFMTIERPMTDADRINLLKSTIRNMVENWGRYPQPTTLENYEREVLNKLEKGVVEL